MTEEEAIGSTKRMDAKDVDRGDRFMKARETPTGEYVEEATKELAKNIVSSSLNFIPYFNFIVFMTRTIFFYL